MTLHVSSYDPECDAIAFSTGDPHDEGDEIHLHNHYVVDYDSATYKPSSFEVILSASWYLALTPEHGYDAETDTVTFGDRLDLAELVVANGDLVVHWGYAPDDDSPEFYTPMAVQLRNASKHLAPAIAKLKRLRQQR